MNLVLALAGITFRDTARRPVFWISGGIFLLASGLSAVPFSPGIAGDPRHYMDAGIATLMIGGSFIALMIVPLLLAPGRGRLRGEKIMALPLGPGTFVAGLYGGFAAALLVFFFLGAALLFAVGGLADTGKAAAAALPGVAWACFFSLLVAALILLFSRFLSYTPAVAAAVLVLILGQASAFLPRPLSLVLPACAYLDPLSLGSASPGHAALALLHGSATAALYLFLAALGLRRGYGS